jgi:hypothetical protein
MAMTQDQWDRIKESSLLKAEQQLRLNPITPSKEHGGWLIYSSSADGTVYVVKPKWTKGGRKAGTGRSKGQYWWLLTCTCPAEGSGFVICWHKSAVYLYWQHCREVNRMEGVGPWYISDGPTEVSGQEKPKRVRSRGASKAVGSPTPQKPKRDTARPAGKPDGGVAPKKRPKSR